MKTYLATFKPIEPYFFGNEKSFVYPKAESDKKASNKPQVSNSYFIKSEYVPSQSTILGALRYIFLPVKKSDWQYDNAERDLNNQTVGANGFNPAEENDFGKIKKISPVFLYDGENALVPAPFDHIEGKGKYTPFSSFGTVTTSDGEKFFAEEYNAKDGVTSDYLNLTTGDIAKREELFSEVTRMGINRDPKNKGMFKKTYRQLKGKYAFAIYLDLEDDLKPENTIVHLGQGKSTFAVSFEAKENNIEKEIAKYLRDDVVYFFGDAFVSADIYKECKFAATKTKTYRYYAKSGKTVTKGGTLYNLISAGSVVIPKDKDKFKKSIENNNVNVIGYNEIITK